MNPGTYALVAVAGIAAGGINAAVGSGTLITYPALLAAGIPPVPANATNNIGLVFGSVSATHAYRGLLVGRWRRLAAAIVAAAVGAVIGALLVLALPDRVFVSVVPWLILFAVAMVIVGGRLGAWLHRRFPNVHGSPAALATAAVPMGAYGGYFGAGQGVVLMAMLGLLYDEDPQRANAAKNLLAAVANGAAAFVFAFSGRVRWDLMLVIAVSATLGATFGGRLAQKASPAVLRGLVVVVGLVAALSLLLNPPS